MAKVSPEMRRHIIEAMADPVDGATDTARKLARLYGLSVATVYRHAARGGAKRTGRAVNAEYRDWARTALAVAHSMPTRRPLPLDLAVAAAVEAGHLPAAALDAPIGTLYRIARELGLAPSAARTQRLHAEYPMQAVLVDGSTSDNLVVVERLDDGDALVRLHRRPYPASGYKNKPLGEERLRLCLYALWDMCTGYQAARYVAARGENALDTLDFLVWVMTKKDDARLPIHGVPDNIWADQGPLFKHKVARDLLARLGIRLEEGMPYQKSRMGGVEQTHRTRWARFERALYLTGRDEFTVSEINDRLAEYHARENGTRPARVQVGGRAVSRTAAWVALSNARKTPLRLLPEGALKTLAAEGKCHVDSNGIVRWGGKEYELDGAIADAWVTCRRPLDDTDRIVATAADGRQHEGRVFVPRPYGEVRRAPASPLERLRQDLPPLTGVDLYAPAGAGEAANVVALPVRTEPAAPLPDPTRPDPCHESLEAAMLAFQELCPWPLPADMDAMVRKLLAEQGCSRAAVRELADDLALRMAAAGDA